LTGIPDKAIGETRGLRGGRWGTPEPNRAGPALGVSGAQCRSRRWAGRGWTTDPPPEPAVRSVDATEMLSDTLGEAVDLRTRWRPLASRATVLRFADEPFRSRPNARAHRSEHRMPF
jgi:hypothetical protein